jgi:hypothetical protein
VLAAIIAIAFVLAVMLGIMLWGVLTERRR